MNEVRLLLSEYYGINILVLNRTCLELSGEVGKGRGGGQGGEMTQTMYAHVNK
jgi:hypothetical protein